jgi:hypothetical protein
MLTRLMPVLLPARDPARGLFFAPSKSYSLHLAFIFG